MPCRGAFFALSATQAEHLLALARDDRLAHVQDGIEATWDEAHLLQTDKAWDAIHRCLTDGTLTIARSEEPLGKLIAGGSQLYADTQNYILNLIHAGELGAVSEALKEVTRDWMKARYEQLAGTDYPQELISDLDWEYTWGWFSRIPGFVDQAQREGRSILFTVDQ